MLIALLLMYLVQQQLASVAGPLAAGFGLPTAQIGLLFSVASVATAIASPLWGLLLDAAGARVVLIAGLVLGVAGPAGFAAVVSLGLTGTLSTDVAFLLVLLFRGVVFGIGIAAVLVAALAVAGLTTAGVGDRTRAVGFVGAAQSLGVLAGPIIAGVLAASSMTLPVYLAPVLALVAAAVVLVSVKPPVPVPHEPVRVRPVELLPAFGAGVLLYLSFAIAEVVVVYLAADRERIESGAIGGVMLAAGLGLLLAQGVLVPVLRWTPDRLLKVGAPVAVAGYALLATAPSAGVLTLALLVAALGVGLGVTGFTATASLGAGPRRQGLVAGLVTLTSGVAFVAGPLLTGVLYEVEPNAPALVAGAAALVATGLAFVPAGALVAGSGTN
ncbi:MFS transporter [Lentzea sp. NBRC 102530]|uniref:MFS transporter n=1 Tax=Lentzea sp. NBRC 102530 TaxID=3032201 RepID=UPI0024A140CD|nr:MFS transporter [Lentzea sp. NBRC 102530]GLY46670.1 MFS transporter [Lentzea sp. NBRC 102530]